MQVYLKCLRPHCLKYFIFISWCAQLLSRGRLFATPWTVAHQALLSMEFFGHEHWSGLPFLTPIISSVYAYFQAIACFQLLPSCSFILIKITLRKPTTFKILVCVKKKKKLPLLMILKQCVCGVFFFFFFFNLRCFVSYS